MKLADALRHFAFELDVDPEQLAAYAAEDTETGWDYGKGAWPCGSLFTSEGQMLYAFTRALKPAVVVEFGCLFGCSSKHLLLALTANKHGKLISVDPEPKVLEERFTAAERKRWKLIVTRGEEAELGITQAGLVFEDTDHSVGTTERLVRLGSSLSPRILLSHDGDHFLVGEAVREGFRRAVGRYSIIRTDDSDCGFAYQVRRD